MRHTAVGVVPQSWESTSIPPRGAQKSDAHQPPKWPPFEPVFFNVPWPHRPLVPKCTQPSAEEEARSQYARRSTVGGSSPHQFVWDSVRGGAARPPERVSAKAEAPRMTHSGAPPPRLAVGRRITKGATDRVSRPACTSPGPGGAGHWALDRTTTPAKGATACICCCLPPASRRPRPPQAQRSRREGSFLLRAIRLPRVGCVGWGEGRPGGGTGKNQHLSKSQSIDRSEQSAHPANIVLLLHTARARIFWYTLPAELRTV